MNRKVFRAVTGLMLICVLALAAVLANATYSRIGEPADPAPPPAPAAPAALPEGEEEQKGPPVMMGRFTELFEQNRDLVGWIRVPKTPIDYPVVYCDDNAFYLSHDFMGNPSKAGTPFLDMNAGILERNRSLSLYGHYLTNETMFAELHKYKELDYYRKYPLFEFSTIYEDGFYKIFAVFYMAGNSSDKLFYYYPVSDFNSDDDFMAHVRQIRSRSIFNTTVDVTPDDQLVLLTCCTYETNNLRLIIAGRKVRPSESIIVDAGGAALNPEPLYPQKWYDAKGGSPPALT